MKWILILSLLSLGAGKKVNSPAPQPGDLLAISVVDIKKSTGKLVVAIKLENHSKNSLSLSATTWSARLAGQIIALDAVSSLQPTLGAGQKSEIKLSFILGKDAPRRGDLVITAAGIKDGATDKSPTLKPLIIQYHLKTNRAGRANWEPMTPL